MKWKARKRSAHLECKAGLKAAIEKLNVHFLIDDLTTEDTKTFITAEIHRGHKAFDTQ